ncbi:MAG TPA: hypothetical protein VGG64_03005 [Pirellulales bacterium]
MAVVDNAIGMRPIAALRTPDAVSLLKQAFANQAATRQMSIAWITAVFAKDESRIGLSG